MATVCSILDNFSYYCFAPEGDFFNITCDFKNDISKFSPQILLIESAWFGALGAWNQKISKISDELLELIKFCAAQGIPSVFWCKEDPIHFHRFLQSGCLFDFVFTTDAESIPFYKKILGHSRVYLLPFACQPNLNCPIEHDPRYNEACFAGSYYIRYPQRALDLERVIDSISTVCPVAIYDRYHKSSDTNYRFPEKYQPFIKGSLSSDKIDIAYKGYVYGINLNTVKNSGSMFARRVFELLGSGTVTISNESPGIRFLFGDLVITSDNADEIRQRLQALVNNPVLRSKVALAGVRKVLLEHTYSHRLERVYSIVFGRPEQKQTLPNVCVVVAVTTLAELQRIQQMLLAQEGVDWRAVLVLADGSEMNAMQSALTDERISCMPQALAEQDLAIVLAGAQWAAGWHANDYYGPNYLLDLLLGTRYCDAPVLGKAAMFCADASGPKWVKQEAVYRPMAHVQARCAVLKAERLAAVSVAEWLGLVASPQPLPEGMAAGAIALDAFSYCQDAWRHGLPQAEVSAVVDDLELNKGHSIDELYAKAEAMPVHMPTWLGKPAWRLQKLSEAFGSAGEGQALHGTLDKFGWHLVSEIPDGDYATIWAENRVALHELGGVSGLKFHVVEGPGLPVDLLVRFESEGGKLLADMMFETNKNQEWVVPDGATHVRLGFRVFSSGTTRIMRFALTWL
ncbi:glycosyltransferase [Limnohabitans sp. DM1]|uniref:CgeB family protein n=1 Tax=Limnohabitans sp. DM1 TaxID=1597955 RepID=UPI000B7F1251|nr:glycosyltransferase [Limnohabitans sp. DM1]